MEGPIEYFSLNALSNFLRRDLEWSLRDSILYLGSPSYWAAWGYLLRSVETGEPSFDFVAGQAFYDRVDNDSEEAAAFHSAMLKNKSHHLFSTIYDFSGINNIVDVGGGSGALLNSILLGHPHMLGTLYDRPIAIEKSAAFFQSEAMPERFSAISGDFFDSVPSGADAYILSLVLMDWEDAKATRILENCARSMRDDGRIIILERIITNGAANDVAFITDLTEMIITGGGLRTENEFSELLLGAGLCLTKVMMMPSGHCVLEARKLSWQAQTIS